MRVKENKTRQLNKILISRYLGIDFPEETFFNIEPLSYTGHCLTKRITSSAYPKNGRLKDILK